MIALLRIASGSTIALLGFFVCVRWYFFWRENFDGGLVTQGPYAWVRHPFYSGFLGFTLGLAVSFPFLETVMLAVFSVVGILYYIPREEEHLLKQYGKDYRDYMRRVPWRVLPRVY